MIAKILVELLLVIFVGFGVVVKGEISTTINGPFEPVTYPFDENLRGNAVDLPDTDHRVQRSVSGFEPEQISVALSSNYDSVWISWVTGDLFLFICFIFRV